MSTISDVEKVLFHADELLATYANTLSQRRKEFTTELARKPWNGPENKGASVVGTGECYISLKLDDGTRVNVKPSMEHVRDFSDPKYTYDVLFNHSELLFTYSLKLCEERTRYTAQINWTKDDGTSITPSLTGYKSILINDNGIKNVRLNSAKMRQLAASVTTR